MATYRLAAEGTWNTRELVEQTEHGLPRGTPVQLEIRFPSRFPGFASAANAALTGLRMTDLHGWDDGSPLLQVHPTEPIWIIRWIKNPIWGALVWTALRTVLIWAIGLTVLGLIAWKLFIPAAATAVKYVLPYLALGAGLVGLFTVMPRQPPEK